MGDSDFKIDISLANQVQAHLAFLKDIDESDFIRKKEIIANAIQRYERFWLPLLSKTRDHETMDPPDDVHWVWHVHMLAPRKYAEDCMNLISTIPDHTFYIGKREKELARQKARTAWSAAFPDEPFDYSIECTVSDFRSSFSYDIAAASERQRLFFYNVSLPHFSAKPFIDAAITRYKKFVNLKRLHPDAFIVPVYDVDLVWHTHQLHPRAYRHDTEEFLGHLLDHDDRTTDRTKGSKLYEGDTSTRKLWHDHYGDHFPVQGVLHRGVSARCLLSNCQTDIESQMLTKGFITLEEVVVSGAVKSKLVLSGRVEERSKTLDCPLYKRSAPFQWTLGLSCHRFPFDTGDTKNSFIEIHLLRHDGLRRSLFPKPWIAPRLNLVEQATGIITQLGAKAMKSDAESLGKFHLEKSLDGVSVDVGYKISRLGLKETSFRLVLGSFESKILPECDSHIWGPVTLPKLLPEIPNMCSIATHRLLSDSHLTQLSVRIIHSLPLRMSVVQLFFKEKMLSVAHLIGPEQLPHPNQVRSMKCPTLNPKKGERAFLIKNHNGDWGVLVGAWTGVKKGQSKSRSKKVVSGWRGHLNARFFDLHRDKVKNVSVLSSSAGRPLLPTFGINEMKLVNLSNGELRVKENCHEVSENLTLAFCVSLLYILCEPQSQRPEVAKAKKNLSAVTSQSGSNLLQPNAGSLTVFRAMGYEEALPSNVFYWCMYAQSMASDTGSDAVECWENCVDVPVWPWSPDTTDTDQSIGGGDESGSGSVGVTSGCGGCGVTSASCASGGASSNAGGVHSSSSGYASVATGSESGGLASTCGSNCGSSCGSSCGGD